MPLELALRLTEVMMALAFVQQSHRDADIWMIEDIE